MAPASVVEIYPKGRLRQFAKVVHETDRNLFHAFFVKRADQMMMVNDIMSTFGSKYSRHGVLAQEFGAVVAFLCSAQAGYITGQTLVVDGGQILPESSQALSDM